MDLSKLSGQKAQASEGSIVQSMSEEVVEMLRKRLQAGKRHNVFPNKFDKSRPFRVSIQYDGQWHNCGTFSNIEVATAIGAIVSVAFYGKSANTGEFDHEAAQAHPEYENWCLRNAEMVDRCEANS